jgi:hypothetical protein
MGLDIRLPIGLLFLALGLVLGAVGVFGPPEIYARSDQINVNLYWGLLLLVFGGAMGFFGLKGTAAMRTAMASADLRAPEGMEPPLAGHP